MIETTGEPRWRRSKRCATGSCVEVARAGDLFLMRDSKNPDGLPLSFDREAWEAFIAGVKSDEFSNV
ncbi:DUF397 domain-containing protein [Actinoplanes siamensis]|uniref:DUF397 domain-containing protein n=1 Tax=Actinoplanes siamensis TaxID=1223317 RepID=A0A919N6K4_9ACTN|nr:DUF397 domain-containing protein [Actinoplanes siamensis]GIF05337.1 hypothetical protein Asi03nite_28750 [Actinoplanes siamensis]